MVTTSPDSVGVAQVDAAREAANQHNQKAAQRQQEQQKAQQQREAARLIRQVGAESAKETQQSHRRRFFGNLRARGAFASGINANIAVNEAVAANIVDKYQQAHADQPPTKAELKDMVRMYHKYDVTTDDLLQYNEAAKTQNRPLEEIVLENSKRELSAKERRQRQTQVDRQAKDRFLRAQRATREQRHAGQAYVDLANSNIPEAQAFADQIETALKTAANIADKDERFKPIASLSNAYEALPPEAKKILADRGIRNFDQLSKGLLRTADMAQGDFRTFERGIQIGDQEILGFLREVADSRGKAMGERIRTFIHERCPWIGRTLDTIKWVATDVLPAAVGLPIAAISALGIAAANSPLLVAALAGATAFKLIPSIMRAVNERHRNFIREAESDAVRGVAYNRDTEGRGKVIPKFFRFWNQNETRKEILRQKSQRHIGSAKEYRDGNQDHAGAQDVLKYFQAVAANDTTTIQALEANGRDRAYWKNQLADIQGEGKVRDRMAQNHTDRSFVAFDTANGFGTPEGANSQDLRVAEQEYRNIRTQIDALAEQQAQTDNQFRAQLQESERTWNTKISRQLLRDQTSNVVYGTGRALLTASSVVGWATAGFGAMEGYQDIAQNGDLLHAIGKVVNGDFLSQHNLLFRGVHGAQQVGQGHLIDQGKNLKDVIQDAFNGPAKPAPTAEQVQANQGVQNPDDLAQRIANTRQGVMDGGPIEPPGPDTPVLAPQLNPQDLNIPYDPNHIGPIVQPEPGLNNTPADDYLRLHPAGNPPVPEPNPNADLPHNPLRTEIADQNALDRQAAGGPPVQHTPITFKGPDFGDIEAGQPDSIPFPDPNHAGITIDVPHGAQFIHDPEYDPANTAHFNLVDEKGNLLARDVWADGDGNLHFDDADGTAQVINNTATTVPGMSYDQFLQQHGTHVDATSYMSDRAQEAYGVTNSIQDGGVLYHNYDQNAEGFLAHVPNAADGNGQDIFVLLDKDHNILIAPDGPHATDIIHYIGADGQHDMTSGELAKLLGINHDKIEAWANAPQSPGVSSDFTQQGQSLTHENLLFGNRVVNPDGTVHVNIVATVRGHGGIDTSPFNGSASSNTNHFDLSNLHTKGAGGTVVNPDNPDSVKPGLTPWDQVRNTVGGWLGSAGEKAQNSDNTTRIIALAGIIAGAIVLIRGRKSFAGRLTGAAGIGFGLGALAGPGGAVAGGLIGGAAGAAAMSLGNAAVIAVPPIFRAIGGAFGAVANQFGRINLRGVFQRNNRQQTPTQTPPATGGTQTQTANPPGGQPNQTPPPAARNNVAFNNRVTPTPTNEVQDALNANRNINRGNLAKALGTNKGNLNRELAAAGVPAAQMRQILADPNTTDEQKAQAIRRAQIAEQIFQNPQAEAEARRLNQGNSLPADFFDTYLQNLTPEQLNRLANRLNAATTVGEAVAALESATISPAVITALTNQGQIEEKDNKITVKNRAGLQALANQLGATIPAGATDTQMVDAVTNRIQELKIPTTDLDQIVQFNAVGGNRLTPEAQKIIDRYRAGHVIDRRYQSQAELLGFARRIGSSATTPEALADELLNTYNLSRSQLEALNASEPRDPSNPNREDAFIFGLNQALIAGYVGKNGNGVTERNGQKEAGVHLASTTTGLGLTTRIQNGDIVTDQTLQNFAADIISQGMTAGDFREAFTNLQGEAANTSDPNVQNHFIPRDIVENRFATPIMRGIVRQMASPQQQVDIKDVAEAMGYTGVTTETDLADRLIADGVKPNAIRTVGAEAQRIIARQNLNRHDKPKEIAKIPALQRARIDAIMKRAGLDTQGANANAPEHIFSELTTRFNIPNPGNITTYDAFANWLATNIPADRIASLPSAYNGYQDYAQAINNAIPYRSLAEIPQRFNNQGAWDNALRLLQQRFPDKTTAELQRMLVDPALPQRDQQNRYAQIATNITNNPTNSTFIANELEKLIKPERAGAREAIEQRYTPGGQRYDATQAAVLVNEVINRAIAAAQRNNQTITPYTVDGTQDDPIGELFTIMDPAKLQDLQNVISTNRTYDNAQMAQAIVDAGMINVTKLENRSQAIGSQGGVGGGQRGNPPSGNQPLPPPPSQTGPQTIASTPTQVIAPPPPGNILPSFDFNNAVNEAEANLANANSVSDIRNEVNRVLPGRATTINDPQLGQLVKVNTNNQEYYLAANGNVYTPRTGGGYDQEPQLSALPPELGAVVTAYRNIRRGGGQGAGNSGQVSVPPSPLNNVMP